jgi:hypothetical protein
VGGIVVWVGGRLGEERMRGKGGGGGGGGGGHC